MARYALTVVNAPTTLCHVSVSGSAGREIRVSYLSAARSTTGTSTVRRFRLIRTTTAGTGTARTAEKQSSLSGAFHGSLLDALTVDPTTTGNPLVIFSAGRNADRQGAWLAPRRSAAIIVDDTELVGVDKGTGTAEPHAVSLGFDDVRDPRPEGGRLARRQRHRSAWFTRVAVNQAFPAGTTTSPKRRMEHGLRWQEHRYGNVRSRSASGDRLVLDAGGGGDATVTPAAIAITSTVPQPAVAVAAAPAAVAAVAALPAPTARGGTTVTPATVATVATVPAPTVVTGAARTPATIAAVVSAPQPAVAVGVAPAAAAVVATVPQPAVGVAAAPAAVAAVVSGPAPAVSVGAAPATIAATSTAPTPTAGQTGGGGATPTPAAVAAVATVPQPAVSVGAAPAAVAAVATLPQPTPRGGTAVAPSVVAALVAAPAPAVGVGAAPAAVAAVATVPAPTTGGGAAVGPATVTTVTTVPKPNVSVGAAPPVVQLTVAVPAPAAGAATTATPTAIAVLAVVPPAGIAVGARPATIAVAVFVWVPGAGDGAPQFVGRLNVLLQIQTLVRVQPAVTTDAYGNEVLSYGPSATRTTFEGWVWQASRGESRPDGRNPAEQIWQLMCNESDFGTDDRIEWPSGHPAGAITFAIEGPPQPSYRAGAAAGAGGGFHHTEATLRILEG